MNKNLNNFFFFLFFNSRWKRRWTNFQMKCNLNINDTFNQASLWMRSQLPHAIHQLTNAIMLDMYRVSFFQADAREKVGIWNTITNTHSWVIFLPQTSQRRTVCMYTNKREWRDYVMFFLQHKTEQNHMTLLSWRMLYLVLYTEAE